MTASGSKAPSAIGFLTVCRHREHGLFGGYLLLNMAGRPLEFHCTAPVKPNRAQEILYGPTLEPYLYGEQIAHTLITKSKVQPAVVFTDRQPVLAARELIETPIVLVAFGNPGDAEESDAPPAEQADVSDGPRAGGDNGTSQPVPAPHQLATFAFGKHELAVSRDRQADQAEIERRCQSLTGDFDLAEPFSRIREAIQEAQRSAR